MDRREALKTVSFIMGGTVIGANAFLTGCGTKQEERINELFTASDVDLLNLIGDTIIPATDTPGAAAVNIGEFMTMMVKDCYTSKDQQAFTKGISQFCERFEKEKGITFTEAPAEERTAFLNLLDKEQEQYTSKNRGKKMPTHYFRIMKELTLLGYFTSEIGCTQARRYVETPGRYDGCIDYKKGDRAWAT